MTPAAADLNPVCSLSTNSYLVSAYAGKAITIASRRQCHSRMMQEYVVSP
jgi:hypothetical protein